MIMLSDKAIEQIRIIQERENKADYYLRIKVVGGGCSGLSYKMEFCETPNEKDKTLEGEGLKIAIDPKSLLFLKGLKIDFTDGLDGAGFVFNNPSATQKCGCGTSFAV